VSCNIQVLQHEVDLSEIQARSLTQYPYLLDSVAHHNELGRYSLLFAFPRSTIECMDKNHAGEFLEQLDTAIQQSHADDDDVDLPFHGGWFVYLGYETVQGIEPSLNCRDFPYRYPVAFAAYCPACIIVDHKLSKTYCVVEDSEADLLTRLLQDAYSVTAVDTDSKKPVLMPCEDDSEDYLAGVNRILEYIRSGDVFQVNLSRAWQLQSEQTIEPSLLFRTLSQSNPAPFACLVHHPMGNIISSSPERLVRQVSDRIETRPIAGTRPRTHDGQDGQWLDELRTDDKERAEHIMLIDLERNDLGRVCVPGSIEVDELMTLESYAHVHHIVSNISGHIRPGVSAVDVIRAVFPGGTITGCPKVRCMEILNELENTGRGPYTGSVGYVSNNGSMDFNILIRTIFQQGERLHFRAGAGIVADSVPERELAETRHKAKGMLLALGAQ
jgi:anthranilate synthase component 1